MENSGTTLDSCATILSVKTIRERLAGLVHEEVGDVPGWVLIPLMTAALVIVIWGLAGPALSGIFEDAISKVSGL